MSAAGVLSFVVVRLGHGLSTMTSLLKAWQQHLCRRLVAARQAAVASGVGGQISRCVMPNISSQDVAGALTWLVSAIGCSGPRHESSVFFV
jgi:CRISPR/Cas system endoribonuclease Cas6 (RAMP superfamily)